MLQKENSFPFNNLCSTRTLIYPLEPYKPCIPIPEAASFEPLGGSKANLGFHSFEIDQMSSRNSWGLSDSTPLVQLNPIHKKVHKVFFFPLA